MEITDRRKIIDKVVKLLALSENNSCTAEAKAAKDKAAELMAKFDISVSEENSDLKFETHKRTITSKAPYKHDKILLNVISRFNGIVYLSQEGRTKGANIFVGRRCDVESNDYMMFVVLSQRETKWKEFRKEFKAKHKFSPDKSFRANWLNGFSLGVQAKLRELNEYKKIKIQEYEQKHGLVVVSLYDQAMNEYTKTSKIKYSKSRGISYNDAGFNAGKSTQIHKGVKQEQTTKMIG
jgi:hypothetical protein